MKYITFNVLQIASQIHFLSFWKYQNAKLYSFFEVPITTSNISFQLRRIWSFCKYALVLFLSLAYLVYCTVSVVIF